jgi:carboxymethylenebutenolidase
MPDGSRMIDTLDGPMRLYEAIPDDGTPKGAVIVIMEAFGLNDHIEDVTRRFSAEGYHAVAPDLFHRSGGEPAAYDDFGRVMELFETVTIDTVERDLDATLVDVATLGFSGSNVGITGFCWGGWVAFLAALRHRFGASVTWYGGGIVETGRLPFPALIDEAASLATPWLGLFGELDRSIPADHLDRLLAELDATSTTAHEIVRYPGADHGFHCDGRPSVFKADAAEAGWYRCIDWLDTHIG